MTEKAENPGLPASYDDIGGEVRSIGEQYGDLLAQAPRSDKYTRDDIARAIAVFMTYGNIARTARAVGIPPTTLRAWFRADWCVALLALLRRQHAPELDAKFSRLVDSAAEQLQDRVDNGEVVLVHGEKHVVPLKGMDLAKIMSITFDKRAILRAGERQSAGGSATSGALHDVLADLAAAGRAIRERDITPQSEQSSDKSTSGEIVATQDAT